MSIEASIVSGTFSSIFAAIRLVQFSIELKGVPESARTFVRLVEQVEEDVEHALQCRVDGAKIFDDYPDFYQRWTSNAINSTLRALDDLGKVILKDTDKWKLDARLEYLLKNYEKLVDQERSLKYSHATLLAAINAMHLMIFQGGTPATRPAWSQKTSGDIRRASSQRPSASQTSLPRQTSNVSSPLSDFKDEDTRSILSDADTLHQEVGTAYGRHGELGAVLEKTA